MCDLYSALFLWYNYLLITLRILYHRLFVSEIAFLKNGQKKTSKSVVDLEALFQPFTILNNNLSLYILSQ